MKGMIAADRRRGEKNFLRRFEDKPFYLPLNFQTEMERVGRMVPNASR